MSVPLFPVTHGVPAEFGLHTGYDFIRQMSVSNPDLVVFDPAIPGDLPSGAVFQLFRNYDFNEEWNGTILTSYIREWIGNHRNHHITLFDLTRKLEAQFYARYAESTVSLQVLHHALNGASVADAKMLTELNSPRIALFHWRNRAYLGHPCGEMLNEVTLDELLADFNPNELGKSLKHIGNYDLRSPVKKMRSSRPFYGDSQTPLIAVQLAVPEMAIFRLERCGSNSGSSGKDRLVLVEHLQFSENIMSFCWDERPATMRDTQSLVILTCEGALFLWQGSDKMRVLRTPEMAEEVCEPQPSVRHTQGVSSITKIAEVGKAVLDASWLPNYGTRLFFSGHPSCLLILTTNGVVKVDFGRSVSTQETLLALFKPPSALDVRHMKLRGQFQNVANERANAFNQQKRKFLKRRKQLLEEDEEAFHTTTQIRLEAEEAGRPMADNPVYKFYSPVLVPFDVEFEAKKAEGPALRLMQDEMLCDAVQHPTIPFRFAILTTIRVYLLDERRPDTPLIQWRHHLVKTRRSLFERRIPFSPEQPHTIQFITPPPHLNHLHALRERTFVLISNSIESEIYTFDEGPTSQAVQDQPPQAKPPHMAMEDSDDEAQMEPHLTPHTEYKRQIDTDLTKLMDAITRDITRPNDAPTEVHLSSQCLDLFRPPPCPPRLLGLAQKAFHKKVPFLEEVDGVNSEHIARLVRDQIQNISTAAMIGPWHIEGSETQLSLLTIRLDIRGNLFAQLHRIKTETEDDDAIAAMQDSDHSSRSDTDSKDSDSQESGSSASSSSSRSSFARTSSSSSSDTSDSSDSSEDEPQMGPKTPNSPRSILPGPLPPFSLHQRNTGRLNKKLKQPWRYKNKALAKPPPELPNYNVYDAAPLAGLVYDPRPGYHPNDSYPKALEERRLKSILECEGDYEKLKDLIMIFSRRERASYRAVKRRIDPKTLKLAPSETRHHEDPDWYDASGRVRKPHAEGSEPSEDEKLDDSIANEDGNMDGEAPMGDEEGHFGLTRGVGEDINDFRRRRFKKFMRRKTRPAEELSVSEEEQEGHPVRKRVLRRLPDDKLDLSQVQFDYFLENLEDVLRDIDTQNDWATREVPPIDAKFVLDAFPIDRASMERIVRRALVIILTPTRIALRTTGEIYRELVNNRCVHPLYFPPAFLRSILSYYVAKGTFDYVSLRGIQTHTDLVTDRYPSNAAKPWTDQDRILARDRDPYMHYLNLNDELDAFILNPTGLMDVDANYFIGKTDTPRNEPIPANREKSTVSEYTWRSPRLPYPPLPEEVITTPSSIILQSQPDLAPNALFAQPSQLNSMTTGRQSSTIPLNMSSSQFMPPTQPISQFLSSSPFFGTQSLSVQGGPSSIPLNRSLSLAFAPPTQPLSRQQTVAQIRADQDKIASRTADLQSQQSQIMELLQTQQTIADIHKEQEMRELEEDKKEDVITEKLQAPANASQLMALLLCKWQADYDSFASRVPEARKILRTVPREE